MHYSDHSHLSIDPFFVFAKCIKRLPGSFEQTTVDHSRML